MSVAALPDTAIGSAGFQEARVLFDGGTIGKPLAGPRGGDVANAMELCAPESAASSSALWSQSVVFDAWAPIICLPLVTLLGPVASVQAAGKIGFEERVVTAPESPMRGQSIKVETLTDVHALLDFKSGVHVTFMAS